MGNNEEVFLGRRFIDNDGGDNDNDESACDDNDNYKINNFTVADAVEPESEEEMEEHDKLYDDQSSYLKSKSSKSLRLF